MLTIEQARLYVTGWDHNRPANFPGLGDFIGWARGIERAPMEICCWCTRLAIGTSPLLGPDYSTKGREKSGKQKVGPSTMMRPPGDGR